MAASSSDQGPEGTESFSAFTERAREFERTGYERTSWLVGILLGAMSIGALAVSLYLFDHPDYSPLTVFVGLLAGTMLWLVEVVVAGRMVALWRRWRIARFANAEGDRPLRLAGYYTGAAKNSLTDTSWLALACTIVAAARIMS